MGTEIVTYTGKVFDFMDPRPEAICIEDIAHSLSHICRYGGHTPEHYSVAQHSCMVANLLVPHGPDYALAGLLHDAHEAYIGDIVTPLKRLLPEIEDMEDAIDGAIQLALGVEELLVDVDWSIVKEADKAAYVRERRFGLAMPVEGIQVSPLKAQAWGADKAESHMLMKFYALKVAAQCSLD